MRQLRLAASKRLKASRCAGERLAINADRWRRSRTKCHASPIARQTTKPVVNLSRTCVNHYAAAGQFRGKPRRALGSRDYFLNETYSGTVN